jgi:hypothetical protein
MRSIFALLILLATFASGQTFTYTVSTMVNGEAGPMNGVPGDLFNGNVTFSNPGASDMQVVMNRFKNDHPPYWAICYCYIQCHNPKDDSIMIDLPPFSSTLVTLQFKTDSVNPGIAYNSFYLYQPGFESQVQELHMTASTMGNDAGTADEKQGRLFLFPNPALTELHFSSSPNEYYQINDAIGNVVLTGYSTGNGKTNADVSELAPGLYFLYTNSGLNSKFIKIRD